MPCSWVLPSRGSLHPRACVVQYPSLGSARVLGKRLWGGLLGRGLCCKPRGEITWGCHVLPLEPERLGFSGSLRASCGLPAGGASVGQGQVHDHLRKLAWPGARQREGRNCPLPRVGRGEHLCCLWTKKSHQGSHCGDILNPIQCSRGGRGCEGRRLKGSER